MRGIRCLPRFVELSVRQTLNPQINFKETDMAFFRKTKQELEAALAKLEAAENRIQDLEADFHAIEHSMALMVLSRDGLIERVSDELLTLLGHQREDLIGQHHRVLCKSEYSKSEDYIVFWRELSIGKEQEGRFVNLDADGGEVEIYARYLPVLSEKGVVVRVIVLMDRYRFTRSLFLNPFTRHPGQGHQ